MIIDGIISLASIIIPPAFDFIKKKFISSERDTTDETLQTLATTAPERMADFVNANAALLESQSKFYNRDVIGEPSRWIIDVRAAIRPVFIIITIPFLFYCIFFDIPIDQGIKLFLETVISSWFGSQLKD